MRLCILFQKITATRSKSSTIFAHGFGTQVLNMLKEHTRSFCSIQIRNCRRRRPGVLLDQSNKSWIAVRIFLHAVAVFHLDPVPRTRNPPESRCCSRRMADQRQFLLGLLNQYVSQQGQGSRYYHIIAHALSADSFTSIKLRFAILQKQTFHLDGASFYADPAPL